MASPSSPWCRRRVARRPRSWTASASSRPRAPPVRPPEETASHLALGDRSRRRPLEPGKTPNMNGSRAGVGTPHAGAGCATLRGGRGRLFLLVALLVVLGVPPAEALHASRLVEQLLLTGEERVAVGADFDVQLVL